MKIKQELATAVLDAAVTAAMAAVAATHEVEAFDRRGQFVQLRCKPREGVEGGYQYFTVKVTESI